MPASQPAERVAVRRAVVHDQPCRRMGRSVVAKRLARPRGVGAEQHARAGCGQQQADLASRVSRHGDRDQAAVAEQIVASVERNAVRQGDSLGQRFDRLRGFGEAIGQQSGDEARTGGPERAEASNGVVGCLRVQEARGREVPRASDMVGVEVRENDTADVLRGNAEPGELPDGGVILMQNDGRESAVQRIGKRTGQLAKSRRVAGIEQNPALRRVANAGEAGRIGGRTQRAAPQRHEFGMQAITGGQEQKLDLDGMLSVHDGLLLHQSANRRKPSSSGIRGS